MAAKSGSAFERLIATRLSLWWSAGERDDLFWRSAGSGGRAKSRGRKGKKTHGHHGDIAATHSDGEPLMELLTIELKRGYSKTTVADMLDKLRTAAVQEWESWVLQTIESHEQAGSHAWLLVQSRKQRQPIVFYPSHFHKHLAREGCFIPPPVVTCTLDVELKGIGPHKIHCLTLEDFLARVTKFDLLRILKKYKEPR